LFPVVGRHFGQRNPGAILNELKRQLDAALPAQQGPQDFVAADHLFEGILQPEEVERSIDSDCALRELGQTAFVLEPDTLLLG
jgi:hypothetical protein